MPVVRGDFVERTAPRVAAGCTDHCVNLTAKMLVRARNPRDEVTRRLFVREISSICRRCESCGDEICGSRLRFVFQPVDDGKRCPFLGKTQGDRFAKLSGASNAGDDDKPG